MALSTLRLTISLDFFLKLSPGGLGVVTWQHVYTTMMRTLTASLVALLYCSGVTELQFF